jgi:hypothetical protein
MRDVSSMDEFSLNLLARNTYTLTARSRRTLSTIRSTTLALLSRLSSTAQMTALTARKMGFPNADDTYTLIRHDCDVRSAPVQK